MQQKIGVYNSNNPFLNNDDISKGINLVLTNYIPKIKEKCEEMILKRIEPIITENNIQIQELKREIDMRMTNIDDRNKFLDLFKEWREQCIKLNKDIKDLSRECSNIQENSREVGKKRKHQQHSSENFNLKLEQINSLIEDIMINNKFKDISEVNTNEQYKEIQSYVKTTFDQFHSLLNQLSSNQGSISNRRIDRVVLDLEKITSQISKLQKRQTKINLSKEMIEIPNFFNKKRKLI